MPVAAVAALVMLLLTVPTAAASRLPNPCAALTNSEVAPLLATKVETRTHSLSGGTATCTWQGPLQSTISAFHPTVSLSVSAETKAGFIHNAKRIPGAVRVSGVGGVALLANGGFTLAAWSKGFAITIAGSLVKVYPDRAETAAKIAFSHLA